MDEASVENHASASLTGSGVSSPSGRLVDEAARVAATLNDKLPTLSQEARISGRHQTPTEAAHEPHATAAAEAEEASGARALPPPIEREEPAPAERVELAPQEEMTAAATQTDPRGGMRQRAVSVGASVGESLRPRVEKMRDATTVVFDEASDDPGLRFIIVAIVLFLCFLFILLFSYILG